MITILWVVIKWPIILCRSVIKLRIHYTYNLETECTCTLMKSLSAFQELSNDCKLYICGGADWYLKTSHWSGTRYLEQIHVAAFYWSSHTYTSNQTNFLDSPLWLVCYVGAILPLFGSFQPRETCKECVTWELSNVVLVLMQGGCASVSGSS